MQFFLKMKRFMPLALASMTLSAIIVGLFSCGDGNRSVNDLYKFNSPKSGAEFSDVRVQVNVDYKLESNGGPKVEIGNQDFLLHAFLLGETEQQVAVGLVNQEPEFAMPVTLTGTHLSFDALVRIPAGTQVGAEGYTFRFALEEKASALNLQQNQSNTIKNLKALKTGVQPGMEASQNGVVLSLATTLAYEIAVESGAKGGSSAYATAYQALLDAVGTRLKKIEATIDTAATPNLDTFASALLAGIKYELMKDQEWQTTIANILLPAAEAAAGSATAASSLATSFTQLLKTFATDVNSKLGTAETSEIKLFKVGTIDPAAIPEPSTYNSVIFAPAGLTFTDNDAGQNIGGNVLVASSLSDSGIESYNVYFGGETIAQSRTKLLGNVVKGASPQTVILADGTQIPTNVTRFWVYPVVAGKELELGTSIVIVNVGGTSQPPSTPLSLSAITGQGSNTITWSAADGATSYNLYWSTKKPVSMASNKVRGATSPYTHAGLTDGSNYYYAVSSVSDGVESPLSTEVEAKSAVPQTPAPTGVAVAAGDGQMSISWNAVTGASSYNIYWATTNSLSKSSTKIAGVTSPYVHTGRTNGTTHYYTVTAVKDNVESELSTIAHGMMVAAPANLTAQSGTQKVQLQWDAVAGASNYYVYWANSSGVSKSSSKIEVTGTSYLHQSLVSGTYYYYVVTTVADGKESAISSEASALPTAPNA